MMIVSLEGLLECELVLASVEADDRLVCAVVEDVATVAVPVALAKLIVPFWVSVGPVIEVGAAPSFTGVAEAEPVEENSSTKVVSTVSVKGDDAHPNPDSVDP